MKVELKKLVIFLVIIMVLSFATAGIIILVTGDLSIKTEEINESKTFKSENIGKIYVNTVKTDVNIIPADKNEIEVHFHGDVSINKSGDLPSLITYVSGDELSIEILRPEITLVGFRVWKMKLDVYIPEDSLEVLRIETVSSNSAVDGLSFDDFDYKTTSGNLEGGALIGNDLKLDTTSGDISIEDYRGDVSVNSISGDVTLKEGRQNDDIEIVTISGDVYIEQQESSNIDVETVSGEIEVNLSEEAKFYLNVRTVSGDIKNVFPIKIESSGRDGLEGTVGSGEKEIEISTTSGNVSLSYR